MGAGQRGLAEILSDEEKDVEEPQQGPGAVNRLQLLCATGLEEKQQGNEEEVDEAEVLREQVSLFEDQVRQLISRINWLQENLQQEEESRLDAERQAECLRQTCTEQAEKVEELSEQIGMLFQDLDEQHKHWTSLEAKLEFEQQERLHIEATLKALAAGAVSGFLSFQQSPQSPQSVQSPQSPQSPHSQTSPDNNNLQTSDGWSPTARLSTTEQCRTGVSWSSNLDEEELKKHQGSKADSMFKELNSEWSNYKSEGKLGSWSLAKVLRRLSFSDAKKRRLGAAKDSTTPEVAETHSEDSRRVYDTAKLTEEIFSLNSEASDVRQRHLADLRKRLELQQQDGDEKESTTEAWSDLSKTRLKTTKVSRSASRSSTKKLNSHRTFESDSKAHSKLENLGRQVFHLKKLCSEKTQLAKLEKRRRNEVENRYYVLVKNLEKQVLQLRKINLRKADEIKQERTRRQEAEKKTVVEVETLERQVVRLSKLAEARAHDLKNEQKQRIEAQKRLKDLVSQLKTSRVAGPSKPERSPKTRQTSVKSPVPSSTAQQAAELARMEMAYEQVVAGRDDGEFVELEALQFRKLGMGDTPDSERQIWKLQPRQKGRFVLTQMQHSVKAEHGTKQEQEVNTVEHLETVDRAQVEKPDVVTKDEGPAAVENHNQMTIATCSTGNQTAVGGFCSAESHTDNQGGSDNDAAETKHNSSTVSLDTWQAGRKSELACDFNDSRDVEHNVVSRPGSLTKKILQLKETTTRLLKDLEGTQVLMNKENEKLDQETPENADKVLEEQGKFSDSKAGIDHDYDNNSNNNNSLYGLEGDVHLKQHLRHGFRNWNIEEQRQELQVDARRFSLVLPTASDALVEISTEAEEDNNQVRGWMVDVKAQLGFLEKLMVRLGGLVFDRAQNIQEQLCKSEAANRNVFEAKVEVLEQNLREVRKVLVEKEGDGHEVVVKAGSTRRYDGLIGLRFILNQFDSRTTTESTMPDSSDFF